MIEWKVPLFHPSIGGAEEQAVASVLASRWLTMGEQVQELETRFQGALGGAHVVAVTNCTAGLHLAFAALGVGAGDEVVLPSLTFVATANAVRYTGARPVFADVTSHDDPSISPEDLERRITTRTKAVCAVHYAGFPADMVRIQGIASKYGLVVVEDCAHALFSSLEGTLCGVWGDAAAFSFFSNKNMTCGEGGLVVTRSEAVARECRLLRSHGMTTVTLDRHEGRASTYDVVALGFNYRLDELRAALALAQFERLPTLLAQRAALYQHYREALRGLRGLVLPSFGRRSTDVGVHIFPVVLPPGTDRNAVMAAFRAAGIQVSIHYPPVHLFSAYKGWGAPLPVTEDYSARELTLPFFPGMTADQVEAVVTALRGALA